MATNRKWIFLRGLIRWHAHWGDFVDLFKKEFPEDEILLLDLPGFGKFHHQKSPKNMHEILDHLDQQVDFSQGPFHVLAFSFGAMVVANWAERSPENFQKLFLINTSDKRSPFYQRFYPRNAGLLLSRFINLEAHFLESGILNITSNRPEVRTHFLPLFIQEFLKAPFSRISFLRQMRMASRMRFPDKAPVPAVFLTSTADRLVSSQCSARIALDWGCILEIHKQAGHDIALDDSPWLLKQIQTHL